MLLEVANQYRAERAEVRAPQSSTAGVRISTVPSKREDDLIEGGEEAIQEIGKLGGSLRGIGVVTILGSQPAHPSVKCKCRSISRSISPRACSSARSSAVRALRRRIDAAISLCWFTAIWW